MIATATGTGTDAKGLINNGGDGSLTLTGVSLYKSATGRVDTWVDCGTDVYPETKFVRIADKAPTATVSFEGGGA